MNAVTRRNSISTRLTLMVAGILTMAVLVTGGMAMFEQERQLKHALETKATSLAQFMAQVSPLSVLSLNFIEMNNNVKKVVLTDDEAVYAIILNEQGIPLVYFFKDTDSLVTPPIRNLVETRKQLAASEALRQTGRILEVTVPILSGEKRIGSAILGLSFDQMRRARFSQIINIGIFLAVIIGLSIMSLRLALQQILRPVEALTATATQMSAGDLNVIVTSTDRADELGILARAFESMAVQLKELIAGLEQRVAERTAQLSAAKEQAEKANRAKSVFLASMSHELRTPLNAVLGFSQLMKNSPDVTPDQMESLNIITRSGEHLLSLINNVLDISKIESGRAELEESPLDLHQLIQEVKSLMYMRAHEKGLDFTLEQSPDLPRHVVADGSKLRQVLLNLIGNAIKYTREGSVTLKIEYDQLKIEDWKKTAVPGQSSIVNLQVSVIDTGPGIRAEDRERIFLPFVQLEDRPSAEAGTGLGLAICKQYVELMGGTIRASGEVDKGAIFRVDLPVVAPPSEAIPVEPRPGRAIGLADGQPFYRILIAEDQPENRLLLRKLLEPFGFDLREAVNGEEAVAIAEEWRPHLIWMDIRMPVMDGLEATRRIKSAEAGAGIRIVAITAHALEEERRTILAVGCDDFIRKPYNDFDVIEALTKNLGVCFVYEEETTPAVVTKPLNADALAGLPAELRHDLEQALVRLDNDAVGHTIEKIRARQPALAEALAAVAGDLQFGRMLRLLRSAPHDTNKEDETCQKP